MHRIVLSLSFAAATLISHSVAQTMPAADRFSSGFAHAGVKNLPYSLLATTTSTQTLQDGTVVRRIRQERRMRDSLGRTRVESSREEHGIMTPAYIVIVDPSTRTKTMLHLRSHTAEITHFALPTPRSTSSGRSTCGLICTRSR